MIIGGFVKSIFSDIRKCLNFVFFGYTVNSNVTTSILVVGRERVNLIPKKLFENLILPEMVSKYIY